MNTIQTKDVTISFDFDETLSKPDVQEVAKSLIERGYNVIITTTRLDSKNNSDLDNVADFLGIKSVTYTNYEDKHLHLRDKGVDIHIDNDKIELFLIQQYTKVEPIDVNNKNWVFLLNELLYI